MTRLLDRFAAWFASSGGVWQTAMVTLLIVVGEATGLLRDAHGFWLLYWLTVYSAVTQPALAYSGAVQGRRTDELLARIEQMEETILDQMGSTDAR